MDKEEMMKKIHIHTMEYYSAIEKEWNLCCTWKRHIKQSVSGR